MKKGTVKSFDKSKGYGFITDDESLRQYFVKASDLEDDITEHDEVEFELDEGSNAVRVRRVR